MFKRSVEFGYFLDVELLKAIFYAVEGIGAILLTMKACI